MSFGMWFRVVVIDVFELMVTDVGPYNIRNNIASRAGECGSETSYSRLQNVVPERRFQGFGMSFRDLVSRASEGGRALQRGCRTSFPGLYNSVPECGTGITRVAEVADKVVSRNVLARLPLAARGRRIFVSPERFIGLQTPILQDATT